MCTRRLDGFEVLLAELGVGLHCLFSGLPSGGADLIRVVLHVLHGLQRAEGLVNASPDSQVVDGRVLDNTLLVDDEQTPESNALQNN